MAFFRDWVPMWSWRTTRWRSKKCWRCSTSPSTGSSTPAGAPAPLPPFHGETLRQCPTVELMKEIAEQLVDVPMPRIPGISWQLCRGACLRARSFEEIVEMTQFFPHERIVEVFPVPRFRNKLWKSLSFFRRSGSAASWWPVPQILGKNRGGDHLVRVTVEQIVVTSATNHGQNRGGDQQF